MKSLGAVWVSLVFWMAHASLVHAAAPAATNPVKGSAQNVVGASLKRALVIGNGAYSAGPLENAPADAALMAEALKKNGFEVSLATDLTRAGMFQAIQVYAASLANGAISVVYFAGHGMQVDGRNFLIPVDMVPTSPASVGTKSFPLSVLLEQLASTRTRVNLVILDACRNDPFLPAPAVRLRSFAALGLAPAIAPRGTLIAYSTAPGQQAADGTGRRHSLYTQTLATLLEKGGLRVEELLKTVADQVRRISLEDQQPWYESSLVGNLDLSAPVTAPSGSPDKSMSQPMLAGRGRSLVVGATNNNVKASIGHDGDAAWFRTMTELEWTELDNEMNLRAANLSEDQIPGLQKQASHNNVVALTTLAMVMRAGTKSGLDIQNKHRLRFDPNMGKAIALYKKAALLGFPVAQAELGEIFYRGREADKDVAEGIKWLAMAAQAQYPRAKIDLAQIQVERSGRPEDMSALMQMILGNTRTLESQSQDRKSR